MVPDGETALGLLESFAVVFAHYQMNRYRPSEKGR